MIFSKMSKNSAADCPRLYVRSSQQLREFKVSNELLTHRVVITLSCSSHIVTFAIHTFDLHKILCLCVSSHYWNLVQRYGEFTDWGKSYYRYDFRVSFFLVVLYHCLILLSYTIVLATCLKCLLSCCIVLLHCLFILSCRIVLLQPICT